MTHVQAGEVRPGDELVGFDHDPIEGSGTRRRMRVTAVIEVHHLERPCYQIITRLGRQLIVDSDQMLLTTGSAGSHWRWRRARKFIRGDTVFPFPWAEQRNDHDAGYMAGIFDGEGWMTGSITAAIRMGFCQSAGVVLDKAIRILANDGFSPRPSETRGTHKRIFEVEFSSWPAMRALQLYQPVRLITARRWVGRALPRARDGHKFDHVERIRIFGFQPVVAISTESRTYIAEGICMRSCHQSRELSLNHGQRALSQP